jgi:hypothetical protein
MKNLLWIGLLAFGSLWGQGSLQFNRVKLVTAQETVPVGKVWKVESVIYNIPQDGSPFAIQSNANCNENQRRTYAIVVDGIPTKAGELSSASGYTSDFFHMATKLPIWLPAGATLSGGLCNNKISVIEFNILP